MRSCMCVCVCLCCLWNRACILISSLLLLFHITTQENNLLSVSPDFEKNPKLIELRLNNNRLVKFPNLKGNTALNHVGLGFNQLTTIPAFVARLPELKYLDVSDNNIQSLDALATTGLGLANETLLVLGGNPVCSKSSGGPHMPNGGGSGLGAMWFASCHRQCSRTCAVSISWAPADLEDSRNDGECNFGSSSNGCNTTACSYDGGDCL